MYKVKRFLKRLFTPVSIMMIPHDSKQPINIKMPTIGVVCAIMLCLIGSLYVFSVAIDTIEYYQMKDKVQYYSAQFSELRSTMNMLKRAEGEFRNLLAGGSNRKELLEKMDRASSSDAGSIDMEALKQQIRTTVESVSSIQQYLMEQRDRYVSTPTGWPVEGHVTSGFGNREHPKTGEPSFHSGMDISVPVGTKVKATADGIVSFSGWHQGSGYLVVIEHGFGFSTCYAHNKDIAVKVGQKVKRGEVIARSGNTGFSTGPHVHYEVWSNGNAVNPRSYLEGTQYVSKEKR